MTTSGLADEIEIVASVAQSQSQPPLEPATGNPAEQRAPIPLLDTLDSTTHERKSLSSSETSGMFFNYYCLISKFDVVSSEFFSSQETRTHDFEL